MDSLTPKTSHGNLSQTLKKSKRKSADYVPHRDLSEDNISVDKELDQLPEEKGQMKKHKKKKHKNKDNLEGSDVTELSEVVESDKKRKRNRDICASGEMGGIEQNVCQSLSPKKKKRSMEETKSFVKIGEEYKANVSQIGKRKSLKINLSTANDSTSSFLTEELFDKPLHQVGEENDDSCKQSNVKNPAVGELCEATEKKKKKKESNLSIQKGNLNKDQFWNGAVEKLTEGLFKKNHQVGKESDDTSRQNQFENPIVTELYEAAGKKKKKKKKKESNLCMEEEGFSEEQCVKDILGYVSAPVLKKDKTNKVIGPLATGDFGECLQSDNKAPSFKKKKKKDVNDSSFMETACSLNEVREEPIEEVLPPRKKKRKHRSSSCDDEEADKRLNNKKGKPLQEDMSLETNKNIQLQPRIDSAEGNYSDVIVLDGCSKKERKTKKSRGQVSGSRTSEESHDSNSLYQENIVEKLWDEIKLKIEGKIQDGRKNQNEETASHQPEEVQAENDSDEVEEALYSIVFKFDNNPNVRHYVPRKLIALNRLNLELQVMEQIDLKVPRTYFKGSSLDKIPGYGYST